MNNDARLKTVAVIVHNDVKRDARVLKEVRSLRKAGLDVTVFGLSDTASSWDFEGATIQLTAYRGAPLQRLKYLFFKYSRYIAAAALLGGAILLGILAPGVGVTAFLAGLTLMLLGLGYVFRHAIKQVILLVYRFHNWHAMARVLEQAVQPEKYDVVHSHDIIGLIAGSRLKERHPEIRLIWDAHEIYEQQGKANHLNSRWLRFLIKRHTRNADAFITINDSIESFYQQHYSLPPSLVVMNATVFAGPVSDDGRLRTAAQLGAKRKILLFHGGFAEHRGIPQLMEAARNLPEPWSIVMMGWGKADAQLRSLASELEQVNGRENAPLVVLPPVSQEELPAWVAGADLGVIPYEDVGLNHLYCTPNKLWEYPNAGVPILATSLVEMEKMVSDWETGFLLPRAFSGEDIVRTLENISENELEEKRAKCLEFSERLSWQVFESNLLKAYDGA